jgi:metal-dependent HD superfamily phosphatase/phosphodiesterase
VPLISLSLLDVYGWYQHYIKYHGQYHTRITRKPILAIYRKLLKKKFVKTVMTEPVPRQVSVEGGVAGKGNFLS